jgi:hypothetical protein
MSWVNEKRKEATDAVVDVFQEVGGFINDEVIDPVTDVVSEIPVVGDITGAAEDLWKEEIRPVTGEVLTAVGSAVGGPIGGAAGGAAGALIEGGNSDDALIGGVKGGISGAISSGVNTLTAPSTSASIAPNFGETGLDFNFSEAGDLGLDFSGVDAVTDTLFDTAAEASWGDMLVEGVTSVGDAITEFFDDPVGSIVNLGNTAMEKVKAELMRMPGNIAEGALDLLRKGGDAAQDLTDTILSGGGVGGVSDILEAAGTIYSSERAADEQAEAIRYATDVRLEAARESMELQRELADRGFEYQERGMALGGPWREAGMGALDELYQLQGLGTLSNRVDPYTGQMLEGPPTTADRAAAQQGALSRFKTSPGYEFRLGEGVKAIDRLASARGYMGSTRAAREAQRYGEGLASQEYNNYVNRLQNLATGGGQQVGAGASSLGGAATQATNLGTNLGRTAMEAGDARASGYISSGAYGASQWNQRGNLWQEYL